MTAWWSSASLTFRHRLRKVAVLMQYVSGVMFKFGTPIITTGIKLERLPRAMWTLLPELQAQEQEKATTVI